MHEGKAKGSQLIIYPDGTIYHIDLKRDDNIPPNLFFVGSAGRVDAFARQFDSVTLTGKIILKNFTHRNKDRPEFYIVAGSYQGIPMAAMSCGIGLDNIEIVLTEFHGLFEYDHPKNRWALGSKIPELNIIRVGSCGTSLKNIPPGSIVISDYSLGLDNLGAYYPASNRDKKAVAIEKKFLRTKIGEINPLSYCSAPTPYVVEVLKKTAYRLGEINSETVFSGITTASPGFFGPEGRAIGRIKTALSFKEFLHITKTFEYDGMKIVNHEMETSILFRLACEQLGYNAGAICLVLDNLVTDDMIEKELAQERMDKTIKIALEAMVALVKK